LLVSQQSFIRTRVSMLIIRAARLI
jgi:hypothetical protein